ncbi:MAG: AAA family ATPase [Anaerolineae bacterium]|nr:AAA family ATPase [Anaerolineae bacterium]
MYLHQLNLKNIACFSELTLDFTRDGAHCPWVVLLGENGTGKSTILQMLALALLGRDLIYQVANDINWTGFVRSGGIKKGRIEITLVPTKQDKKADTQKQYQAAFEMGRTAATGKTGLSQDDKFEKSDYERLDNTLYSYDTTLGWFACGYGPWRRLSPPGSVARSGAVLEKSRLKSQRFVTMFNSEVALTVVSDWLVDLEFRRLKAKQLGQNKQVEQAARALRHAVKAIETILPDVRFKEITSEGQVIVTDNEATVAIDQLSDGYRSTLAWVIDLVRRLIEAFPKGNPLEAEGVVLVDEIALHLHPQWQRKIVEHIRQTFPRLQFIVTSHSPFVAQDMREEDKIIVLKKGKQGVQAQESDISIANWRVDQILTSYLFDLETTRNVTIGAMEQEYQQLLDKQTTPAFTAAEAQRLTEIKKWLDQHQAPLGETPAENDVFDTATSLIELLDKYIDK